MAEPAPQRPFSQNRFLQVVLSVWAIVWIWTAIDPVNRGDWAVENLLVVGTMPFVVWAYRRLPLSNFSYALLAAFLILHTVGAHYAYRLPLGDWARDAFDLRRNHYDRVVHFAFGLLCAYPIRELLVRTVPVNRFWAWWVPVASVGGLSAIFENLEMLVAWIADPELGAAYLGTQGDEWDAQKDMALAIGGALLASLATLGKSARTTA
jgi:putative membrane protein